MATTVTPLPVDWDIHCDESSQTKHRYTVIGALYGRADATDKVVKAIEDAIAPHGGTSELKWTKIRPHNVRMYKALMDALHPLMKGTVRFHCLVVDTTKARHREYNEGDRELGFTKYAFTLLFKFARIHRKRATRPHFYVHLDYRKTKYNPDVTRITLNYKDASTHGRDYEAYKLVHFVRAKKNRVVQAADVITGAIASAWNQNHLAPDAAPHKKEMVDYIANKWFLPSLAAETTEAVALRGIDIWLLDWDWRKKKLAPRS